MFKKLRENFQFTRVILDWKKEKKKENLGNGKNSIFFS